MSKLLESIQIGTKEGLNQQHAADLITYDHVKAFIANRFCVYAMKRPDLENVLNKIFKNLVADIDDRLDALEIEIPELSEIEE